MGIILNNDSVVSKWNDYYVREAWHVCIMTYGNLGIFHLLLIVSIQ
jgi:hypothetical protein